MQPHFYDDMTPEEIAAHQVRRLAWAIEDAARSDALHRSLYPTPQRFRDCETEHCRACKGAGGRSDEPRFYGDPAGPWVDCRCCGGSGLQSVMIDGAPLL